MVNVVQYIFDFKINHKKRDFFREKSVKKFITKRKDSISKGFYSRKDSRKEENLKFEGICFWKENSVFQGIPLQKGSVKDTRQDEYFISLEIYSRKISWYIF